MMADKIDIGSMGDYPLLINAARGQQSAQTRTKLVAITGYNSRGGLNSIVVAPDSPVHSLADLRGRTVSTSVGSAGHGLLVQAARKAGLDPGKDFKTENQQPQVGASALQSGAVAALSQFVAWPGLLVFNNQARVLYDGGALGVPTLHGVVVRERYASEHPDVLRAFLAAQLDATGYLHQHPLEAAQTVADATGLPPEVVYLYNGPNGVATFDVTVKPLLRDALAQDVPFLKEIGVLQQVDLAAFVDDRAIREVAGAGYDRDLAGTANPAAIAGTDPVCGRPVTDPARAGEIWPAGAAATQPAATPTCLLRALRALATPPRAAYVPDTVTGTRWFADRSVWVRDPSAGEQDRFKPFTTADGARSYVDAHPGSAVVSFADARSGAGAP
ncbi:ABC transporter substrate-binding protein [Dactylosporangium sp. NPDC049140]|uniref:ABC transporter substrate-binding protein n=1 Tax=Dactylosporangium sp. NPDC049140 TaxID=3155647 RepID=UPI0033CBC36F